MDLNYVVLSEQYCAIWVIFVTKWTLGLHFICTKSPSPWKNNYFCVQSKNSTFPIYEYSGLFVHRARSVANNISKNLNSHKMSFLWLNSLEVCWAPKNFRLSTVPTRHIKDPSTFDKWKLLHINFCLLCDVWCDQINQCIYKIDPNNF